MISTWKLLFFGLTLLFFLRANLTFAQYDPSTAGLLPQGSSEASASDESVDSDRYTVRTKSAPKKKWATQPPSALPVKTTKSLPTQLPSKKRKAKIVEIDLQDGQNAVTAVPEKSLPKPDDRPAKVIEKEVVVKPTSVATPAVASAPAEAPTDAEDKSLTFEDKFSNYFFGAGQTNWVDFREKLPEKDSRSNIMEVSFAPMFIYNDSSSRFWPRKYVTQGSGFEFNAAVWITPFLGLNMNYRSSLAHSVRNAVATPSTTTVQHEWMEVGLRSRRFFDKSKEKASLTLGLDYKEYQMKIPVDELLRPSLQSTGMQVSVESEWQKNDYGQLLFVQFMPILDQVEKSQIATLRSGTRVQSENFGAGIGGRWYFDRHNQMYWKLSHTYERNKFFGQAKMVDPKTGDTLEGVTVTNSFTFLQLGYTWGD